MSDPASGHWVVNGTVQGTNQAIDVTAAQLARTSFQSGPGWDDLWVRAFDSCDWGAGREFHINAPVDQNPVLSEGDANLPLNTPLATRAHVVSSVVVRAISSKKP